MQVEGLNELTQSSFEQGYMSSAPNVSGGNFMAAGSTNISVTGTGKTQVHKGPTKRASVKGGLTMHSIAETYASIGQISDTTAFGNIMNVYAALFYIGKGLVRLAGASLAVTASATLSLLIKRSGSYTSVPESGPWQAGLAQPSAPVIRAVAPPAGFTGKVSGTVAVDVWRIRSTTGAESNASPRSNVISADNQSVAVTVGLPDANGQDAWGVGVTKLIEGRTGARFKYAEFTEAELTQQILRTDITTNAASLDIGSATGGFTSAMIGYTVVLSGGVALSTYVTDVPDPNTLTLAAMPSATTTGVHMALTRAVEGTERTWVIEWVDGDLIGRPYSPSRNFAPPSGLFAETLEDVIVVDGAYPDAETGVTGTNRGTALAPSEPGQPEAFSPDTPIFTNDSPVALLKGDGVLFRVGHHSTLAVKYLGGEKPISAEPVWENIGINYQTQACIGEGGRLYLWPSVLGLIRMGDAGQPDSSFVNPVKDDLSACTDPSKRVLGWDGIGQSLIVCYNKTLWQWMPALGVWSAPLTLSALNTGVRSAVTENGQQLLLTDYNDDIWEFNTGSGTTATVRTPWIASAGVLDTVAAVVAAIRADNTSQPVVIRVYGDGDRSSILATLSLVPSRTGFQQLPTVWPNVIDCTSHQIEVEITSTTPAGDCGVEMVHTFGPSISTLV